MKIKLKIKIKSKHFFYETNVVNARKPVPTTVEPAKMRLKLSAGLVPEFSY